MANVAGPLVGGVLFSIHGVFPVRWLGGPLFYSFTLFTICTFLLLMLSIRIDSISEPTIESEGFAFLAGFRLILANHSLLGPVLLDLVVALFGGAVALMPVFATSVLHAGPTGLALLPGAPLHGVDACGSVSSCWRSSALAR